MVAWEHVCDTKELGGLGLRDFGILFFFRLRDFGIQNTYLLLKMIHRLHSNNPSSWAQWVTRNACIASLTGNLVGNHWDTMRSLLPIYRAIIVVNLADGTTTSFWHDVWDGHDSLAERFPELLSHCQNNEITVKQAYDGELQRSLTARRLAQANEQLVQVTQIMTQHPLSDGRDQRWSPMLKKNGDLDTAMPAIQSAEE